MSDPHISTISVLISSVVLPTPDGIIGLRTQILDNWWYAHPNNTAVFILTTRRPGPHVYKYEVAIVEDCGQSDRVFLESGLYNFVEDALHKILCRVSEMVTPMIDAVEVEELVVKIPSEDDMEAQKENEKPKEVGKPRTSDTETEMALTNEIRKLWTAMDCSTTPCALKTLNMKVSGCKTAMVHDHFGNGETKTDALRNLADCLFALAFPTLANTIK
ncbi:hypothetical protein AUEXF2481DRAFT_7226 [Aureobasidium subglaciale EXF-2481]|uniref:Uncharacterized protein n=1 Tax=Aureobasidium subglaciale (strain EXF-2481) TaxID=1043005 RepID=A0A074Y4Z1_AURSE|nr:uncharacterized protein AUEXF2481DRAFT_7226 [Aureobasidium subglaciale EXF-2481]KAI5198366.1 hypothetical protein E4T38_07569 [Aureobasidium subglaciale]KAI5217137.1 hypothetical protein E4T40_07518 [Aureobasidium subglaciale]KAI5220500.1 hypothetical protein E4T41_07495 [Aureobasidium subglaciale]KAI5258290.1 hypothetical protein E4T46_07472 [Aureobasidium subglaciale]KEQ92858.1 hypothetical protein AUEXF2481DRAFT_7226 [Aureobasidium subglaciale EXF-2481]